MNVLIVTVVILLLCSEMKSLFGLTRKLRIAGGSYSNRHDSRLLSSTMSNLDIPGTDKSIEYNYIELDNSIKVLMIRDPTSQKSSASLAVAVGAASDPTERPGLAHFTGSEKYPKENAYKDYLNKNGGGSNAATGMEATTYKFEVNANAFPEAVSIFSQFFKSPLFTESAIGREVLAVDAEDSKNRILDGRRVLQVMKDQMIENHPYKKFSTGNVNTLARGNAIDNANEVKDAMRTFHNKYYQPQKMALALVGPQELSELESLAKSYFSDINGHGCTENEALSSDHLPKPIFDENNAYPFKKGGNLIRMRPLKDIRDISILWTLPSTRNQYTTDPCRLLRHLLNHKGEGSLFANLQDKGWISSTSAGTTIDYVDFNIFEVSATLTPSGFENYEEIIKAVYNHIDLINRTPDSELRRIWEEIKSISSIDFNFQEKSSAYEIAPFVSKQLLDVPVKNVFSAGYLLDDIDIEQFRSFCKLLIPSRATMILRSETFDWLPLDSPIQTDDSICGSTNLSYNQREPWYGVHYHVEKIDEKVEDLISNLTPETVIPSENRYIAYELANKVDIITSGKLESTAPLQVLGAEGFECWHSKDEVFGHPKSSIFAFLHSIESADGSPVNSIIGILFAQRIARKMYQAGLAGIGYSIDVGNRGISLSFVGYSPRLETLVEQISSEFTSKGFWQSEIDEVLFSNSKERLIRGLKSWTRERPDSQCDTLMSYLLQENAWLPNQRLEAAETMTMENVKDRVAKSLLKGTRLTTYVHGDMNVEQSLSIHKKLSSTVGKFIIPKDHKESEARGRLIPKGRHYVAMRCFNEQEVNNALVMHIQTAVVSPKVSAYMLLIRRFMAEPFFSELRTQQQLGYIVSLAEKGHGRSLGSIRGINFRVLSNRFDPLHLEKEVNEFLSRQSVVFSKLTQQEVSDRGAAIVKSLIEPPKSYLEEAGQFRENILNNIPFDWIQQIIEQLENINVEDFRQKANDWIFDEEKRKSVSFMLFGNQNQQDLDKFLGSHNKNVIKNIEELTDLRDSLEKFSLGDDYY